MSNPQQQYNPPRWADRLLERVCAEEVVETLQGDLHELYFQRRQSGSKIKADLYYFLEVLDMCRPFVLKRRKSNNSNYKAMYYNYLKVAWRNLLKYKTYSAIKIGGFAIGIAAFILISLFVQDELTYDQYYSNQERLFRLINVNNDPADFSKWTSFPAQIGQVLNESFPEIEKAARLIPHEWFDGGSNQMRRADQVINTYEEGFAYADPALLEILEMPMIYGSYTSALSEPNSIVLTKSKADKYFPDRDPIGESIILNDDEANAFKVSGVIANFPSNGHLQFDFFITLAHREFWPGEQTNWCCWNYNPYILVRPGADVAALEEKLLLIRDDYVDKFMRATGNQAADDNQKYHSFELQPIGDVHLYNEDIYDNFAHGDIKIVWLFVAIAGFVLLLASINFINLSTAKSANRAKEVGLRKVVGSSRSSLVQQFLSESILFSLISAMMGLLLAILMLPYFNSIADKSMVLPLSEWWFGPILLGFVLIVGTLSGLYPSFYLSAFRPIDVLKGALSRGSKSSALRSGMVVFQFATSIVLIIGAVMVYRQMQFIMNKDLGFEKEQVLMIQGTETMGSRTEAFKDELLKLSSVKQVASTSYLPVAGTKRDGNGFWIDGRDKIDRSVGAERWEVDKDYISTMGIKLLEGRNFQDMVSDSSSIIINKRMAKELGLKDPIGTKLFTWETWNVIGVIEDFHFENMREEIGPLALCLGDEGSILSVKMGTDELPETLAAIENVWDDFMPNQPIRISFLDDAYERMYADVQRTGSVFTSFSVLAIIVACLGLFGLSAFMVEQRSKEISIRKVLGASTQVIFQLLTVNFLKMIGMALLIAFPIGWYLVQQWLNDFEYRTSVSWDVFAVAGVAVVLIAMITVSYESVKALLTDPVKGLRSE